MAAKRYRALAKRETEEERIDTSPWQRVSVSATFYHKDKRRRDDVNSLAMLKAAYDGIVDAGVIADDDSEHLTTQPAVFKHDKLYPRVEILIERMD